MNPKVLARKLEGAGATVTSCVPWRKALSVSISYITQMNAATIEKQISAHVFTLSNVISLSPPRNALPNETLLEND